MPKKKDEPEVIQILILREKDCTRYIRFPEEDGPRHEIYKSIFQEREDQGWYDAEQMEGRMLPLYEKAQKGDPEATRIFLSMRSTRQFEYETYEIATLEEIA